MKELAGQRFGRLETLERVSINGKNGYWKCICDCGAETIVLTNNLISGKTRSCGCLFKEVIRNGAHTTHGKSGSREQTAYNHMRERCLDPFDKAYHRYGGRGITICDRWLGKEGIVNFLEDMGDCPPKFELERINNNGNYEPGNCRWASHDEQCRNRRPNIFITMFGKRLCLKDMCNLIGSDYKRVHYRYKKGWAISWALLMPQSDDLRECKIISGAAKRQKSLLSLKY